MAKVSSSSSSQQQQLQQKRGQARGLAWGECSQAEVDGRGSRLEQTE